MNEESVILIRSDYDKTVTRKWKKIEVTNCSLEIHFKKTSIMRNERIKPH